MQQTVFLLIRQRYDLFIWKWATSWDNLFLSYVNKKAQISLRTHAVWSTPLLFAAWIVKRFYSSKLYRSIGTYMSPTCQFAESVLSLRVHLFKSKGSVTPHWIALTDVRRRTKFSIRSSPSVCVSCPFFIRRCPFLIWRMCSLLSELRSNRRKVVCMFKTWNGLHQKKAPAGCTVAMRWHAFCSGLVRSLSCTCPVRIRWCPVDLIHSRTTTQHAMGQPDVFRTLTACSADDYWQWTHGNWRITGVKRWSTGPNMTYTWQNFQLHRFWIAVTW